MMFWPVSTRSVQALSDATKDEIARRVADKVYAELRNGNYLESAYVFDVANRIARRAMKFEFVQSQDSDHYFIKEHE